MRVVAGTPILLHNFAVDSHKKCQVSLYTAINKQCWQVFRTNCFQTYVQSHSKNKLLYQYQLGLLPGHSTVYHLIELVHNTCLSLENHEANC